MANILQISFTVKFKDRIWISLMLHCTSAWRRRMVVAAQDALALCRMRAAIILHKNCPLQTSWWTSLCQIGALHSPCRGPLPALLKSTAKSHSTNIARSFAPLQRSLPSIYHFQVLPSTSKSLPQVLHSQRIHHFLAPELLACDGTKRSRHSSLLAQSRSKPEHGSDGLNSAAPPPSTDLPSFSTQAIEWPSPNAEAELAALEPLDCIFVLGGGQRNNGDVPVWVQKRLDATYRAYVAQDKRCPIVVMGGGTSHKPPVLNKGEDPPSSNEHIAA